MFNLARMMAAEFAGLDRDFRSADRVGGFCPKPPARMTLFTTASSALDQEDSGPNAVSGPSDPEARQRPSLPPVEQQQRRRSDGMVDDESPWNRKVLLSLGVSYCQCLYSAC